MPGISDLLAALGTLPRPALIAATAALALAECTLGLGFAVPGESGLLLTAATVTTPDMFALLTASVPLGAAVRYLEDILGQASWLVLGAVVLAVLGTVVVTRRRHRTQDHDAAVTTR
ncbi:hypothetical protein GCM10027174_09640 [Salinifilum aidingensis]